MAVFTPQEILYIHTDHLNAPRLIVDQQNQIAWVWDSDPYGNAWNQNPQAAAKGKFTYNLRFPGQYYDQETGLYYNYFRDYDPRSGRYREVDPIGLAGGLNPYAYVSGNPLKYVDPTGEAAIVDDAIIIGGGAALADGPLPIGEIIGGAVIYEMCSDDEDDENCEALYQSILRTCAGLTGRKKFRCFEAARIARDQCYQERGR